MSVTLTLALLLAAAPTPTSGAAVGYYRFPALRGEVLVFGAEGESCGRSSDRAASRPA